MQHSKDDIRFSKWFEAQGRIMLLDSQLPIMGAVREIAKAAWKAKKCDSDIINLGWSEEES